MGPERGNSGLRTPGLRHSGSRRDSVCPFVIPAPADFLEEEGMHQRNCRSGALALSVLLSFSCGPPGDESAAPLIEVGEVSVLEETRGEPWQAGPLIELSDRSLALGIGGSSLFSSDGAETWSTRPQLPASHILPLRDGTYYALQARTDPVADMPGTFTANYLRLADIGAIFSDIPRTWSHAPVTLPQWTSLTGDDGSEVSTLIITGPLLEQEDGSLLAASYGNFQGDTAAIEGFVPTQEEKWFKYRTYLLRSTDAGLHWSYFSTVAYDGVTGQESFCEPALVDFGDGELLAVMRTGRFAPMFQARSLDGGQTWSRPVSTKILGLAPQMVLLENGVLVCSFGWRPLKKLPSMVDDGAYVIALQDYRRRYQAEVGIDDPSAAAGDYVMVSFDRGHTWSPPRRIARALTVGYTMLAPTGNDSCLVLTRRITLAGYSRQSILEKWKEEWDPKPQGVEAEIEARIVRVRKE